jgi:hypothetical protein
MKRYGKSGWFGDSHRHYLASKGIMSSGADIMMKSNMLGRSWDLRKAYEQGTKTTPWVAHEGSEVLPHAVHEGTEVLPRAFEKGNRYTGDAHRAAIEYAAAKEVAAGYYAKEPKYEHVPKVKTPKQEYAFEEKTGRMHSGESWKHYMNREATEGDE